MPVYLQSAVPTKCRSVSIFKVHPNDADLCVSSEWDANLTCVDVCQRVSTCVDMCRCYSVCVCVDVCRSSECCAHAVPILRVLCRVASISVSIFRVLCLLNADLRLFSECIPTMPICVCRRVSTCVYLQSTVPTQCRSVSSFRVLCLLNANLCLSSECGAYSMPICVYLRSAVPTQCRSVSITVSNFRALCPSLCLSSECCAYSMLVYLLKAVPISMSIFTVLCLSMPVYLQSAVPISVPIVRVLCPSLCLSSECCAQ